GADIYKKLKGSNGSNVEEMNRIALYEIGNVVRQAITEATVAGCNSDINSLTTALEEYLDDPENNKGILEQAMNSSRDLVSRLRGLDVVGIGGYAVAAGLRLAVLQERAKYIPSTKKTLRARAIEYHDYAKNEIARMATQFHARFSECRVER